ncbi:hypothetical protein GQ42DRAFT_176360 [Ramicandelaber brevisporus]|nr:hypothetical protein GQ42DRAFT_176360 [Ramicandelaber brevisporus]
MSPTATKQAANPVVDSAHSKSGLEIAIHPLVPINVADHLLRVTVQEQNTQTRVFGLLLGMQTGRRIEIFISFELRHTTEQSEDGGIRYNIDEEYLTTKKREMAKVFPDYEVVGWYAVGDEPTQQDLDMHLRLTELCTNTLFMLFDVNGTAVSQDGAPLPLRLFEFKSEFHGQDQSQQKDADVNEKMDIDATPTESHKFVRSHYNIETSDPERLTVDEAFRAQGTIGSAASNKGGSSAFGDEGLTSVTATATREAGAKMISHLRAQRNAVTMLLDRAQVLLDYMKLVQQEQNSESFVKNHTALRNISAICDRMPTMDGPEFTGAFLEEYSDIQLTVLLGTITKAASVFHSVAEKSNVLGQIPAKEATDRLNAIISYATGGVATGGRKRLNDPYE